MKRRLLRFVAAAALVGSAAPAARAATQPVGGCNPSGLTLATAADMAAATYGILLDHETFPTVESWAAYVDEQQDKNNDDFICYRVGKPNPGHGGAQLILWGDNRFPRL